MLPLNATIVRINEESPAVRTFFFDFQFETMKPGQFVMVWGQGRGRDSHGPIE